MDSGAASEGKVFQIKSSTTLIFPLFKHCMYNVEKCFLIRTAPNWKEFFFQSLNSNVPKCVFGCSSERPIQLKTKMANSIISKRSLCCTGCVGGYYECSALRGLCGETEFAFVSDVFAVSVNVFWDNRGISVKGKSIKPEGDLALIRLRANE